MQVRVRQIVETPKLNQHALKSVKNLQNTQVGAIRTMMKKPTHCTDGGGEGWGARGARGARGAYLSTEVNAFVNYYEGCRASLEASSLSQV